MGAEEADDSYDPALDEALFNRMSEDEFANEDEAAEALGHYAGHDAVNPDVVVPQR